MKQNLIISMFAAALLGSGVANAAGTLKASEYTGDEIVLGSTEDYDTLVVDRPLTLTGDNGYLDLYDGATIQFQKEQAAEEICRIIIAASMPGYYSSYFNKAGDVYNFTFDAGAQELITASAGTPITLIQDLAMARAGFYVASGTTLKLNGAGYGETVSMGGVEFTYVGPKDSDYAFKAGEIGFTGYYEGSHNLSLVANGKPTPEPTTGTLSLLALAGLCARRRRK